MEYRYIIDHLLFECELLNKERDSLTSTVLKTDDWSISKNKWMSKLFKITVKISNEISYDKINEVLNPSNQVN